MYIWVKEERNQSVSKGCFQFNSPMALFFFISFFPSNGKKYTYLICYDKILLLQNLFLYFHMK